MLTPPPNFSYQPQLDDQVFCRDPAVIYALPVTVYDALTLLDNRVFPSVSQSGERMKVFLTERLNRGVNISASPLHKELAILYNQMLRFLKDFNPSGRSHDVVEDTRMTSQPRNGDTAPESIAGSFMHTNLCEIPPGVLEITSIVNAGLTLDPGEMPIEFLNRYFPDLLPALCRDESEEVQRKAEHAFSSQIGDFLSKIERLKQQTQAHAP